jgi:LysR family glycine cleavage system transcriptional activator
MALQMAAQGNGVALVSALLAAHALRSGQLAKAHDASLPGQEGYYLSIADDRPEAQAFGDWLDTCIRDDSADTPT